MRQFVYLLLTCLAMQPAMGSSIFEGTINTRDLGGYLTTEGLVVRKGLVFRSDSLANLTDQDIEAFTALGLRTVTDLRSRQERQVAPNRLPDFGVKTEVLDVNNPALDIAALRSEIFSGQLSGGSLTNLLSREPYITNAALRSKWGHWLNSVGKRTTPQIFHCTAGKDRTGFASAILLLALGVSERRVMQDFLLSNQYIEAETKKGLDMIASHNPDADLETLRKILGVDASSLTSAVNAMEREYRSIDGFLSHGLKLSDKDRNRLKALLLTDPRVEGRRLTDEEILATFNGVEETSQVADAAGTSATNSWRADNTMTSRWKNDELSGVVNATWTVNDGERCVLLEGESRKRCTPIYEFEGQYFSTNSDGSIHGAHLITVLTAAPPVQD